MEYEELRGGVPDMVWIASPDRVRRCSPIRYSYAPLEKWYARCGKISGLRVKGGLVPLEHIFRTHEEAMQHCTKLAQELCDRVRRIGRGKAVSDMQAMLLESAMAAWSEVRSAGVKSAAVHLPREEVMQTEAVKESLIVSDTNMEQFVSGYLVAALWSSNSCDGTPLDVLYRLSDISEKSRARARRECAEFVMSNAEDIKAAASSPGYSWGSAGHDFWLSRNGHGTGFWDRKEISHGGIGVRLSDSCHRQEVDVVETGHGELDFEGREYHPV